MGSDIDYALGTDFGERFEPDKIIDAAIAFANGDVFPSAESRSCRSGAPQLDFEQAEDSKAYATEILRAAAAGLAPLAIFLSNLSEFNSEASLGLFPVMSLENPGKPSLGWRALGPGGGSMVEKDWLHLAALMISSNTDHGSKCTEIGRCNLCGRFFRVRQLGRGLPSRKYCPGTDHMERAHARRSTERSQIKRRRDAEKKAKSKLKNIRRMK
jgi:hypothetical protein